MGNIEIAALRIVVIISQQYAVIMKFLYRYNLLKKNGMMNDTANTESAHSPDNQESGLRMNERVFDLPLETKETEPSAQLAPDYPVDLPRETKETEPPAQLTPDYPVDLPRETNETHSPDNQESGLRMNERVFDLPLEQSGMRNPLGDVLEASNENKK